jgi:hypothetical protein
MFGFWEMLVYIGIVLVGFFYVWKKGVLDWGRRRFHEREATLMALTPAITDIEQLKSSSGGGAAAGVESRRRCGSKVRPRRIDDLVEPRIFAKPAPCCATIRIVPSTYLSDVTCVDWYPAEPRFEVIYHLLSIPNKERVRLKVRLDSDSPAVESVTRCGRGRITLSAKCLICLEFASADILTCGAFMMPEDWEGHPLRKDYPVEGYR